ncbi:toll/interleukin-1 receptor domain-containing protein [Methylomagnum sp.]
MIISKLNPIHPFLAIYIVWHPSFDQGETIARSLFNHFRRDHYKNIAGGAGLSILYRSAPPPGEKLPLPIDFDEAETTAVILLTEECLVADADWKRYVQELASSAEVKGLGSRVFPVEMDECGLKIGIKQQALRWNNWHGLQPDVKQQRLISGLTYEFCLMLRHYLEHLKYPVESEEALTRYLLRVRVFLSHSKHDKDGERIARRIRDHIHKNHNLDTFFDVRNIPPGLPFDRVLLNQIGEDGVSAFIAIHTDSYSSREWCRKEVIEAKRRRVPLVVANCINNLDERNFPYMGNVPVVRMNPKPFKVERIELVIGCLLDEVLKDFLWRCRIRLVKAEPGVYFLSRPPELISLASLDKSDNPKTNVIVYPDPPLGAEEERLFEEIAPGIRLRSMIEWQAEQEAT